jgi:hypothetical protein
MGNPISLRDIEAIDRAQIGVFPTDLCDWLGPWAFVLVMRKC